MTVGRLPWAIAGVVAAFLISGAANAENHLAAKVECPSFPKVALWGNISHGKSIRYVAKRHDGDWSPYIKKWQRQLAKVMTIRDRGGSIVFKKKGIRLKGDDLSDYAGQLEVRLAVILCLADEDKIRTAEAEKLENFSTAAGSNAPAPQQ